MRGAGEARTWRGSVPSSPDPETPRAPLSRGLGLPNAVKAIGRLGFVYVKTFYNSSPSCSFWQNVGLDLISMYTILGGRGNCVCKVAGRFPG